MKKPQLFGKALLGIGVLSLSLATVSCKDSKPEDPKEVAEDANEAKFEKAESAEDVAETLVDAAEFDLTQRELGKLAQANGVSQEVKDLGKMMETHHNDSFNDLAALAETKTISVPNAITEDGQSEYDKLKKQDAKNFDKDYLNQILDDHKEAIDDFKKESQRVTDPEVKSYLERKVTSLTEHHKAVEALISKLNLKK